MLAHFPDGKTKAQRLQLFCPESQSQPVVVAQRLSCLRKALFFVACCFFTYPLYPEKIQKEARHVLEMGDHTLNCSMQ